MASKDVYNDFELYRYQPSKPAAAVVCAIFCVSLIALVILIVVSSRQFQDITGDRQANRNRHTIWRFVPFLLGLLMEIIGYGARSKSADDIELLAPYIIQSVLLLIAPALYAATIYMFFGQVLFSLGCTQLSIVPARWATTIFVTGDVISFLTQAAGAGIMAKAQSTNDTEGGTRIIVGGLFVQIVFFGLFIITEIRFLLNVKKGSAIMPYLSSHWKVLNLTLLGMSFLILIRSIVRAVEFIEGNHGYIVSHEVFLYVFDALPMMFAGLLWIITFRFGDIFKVIYEGSTVLLFKGASDDDCGFENGDVTQLSQMGKM